MIARMFAFLGIPPIALAPLAIGASIGVYALIRRALQQRRTNSNGYLIKNVHVIVGDGTELFDQNVLIKDGTIQSISSVAPDDTTATTIDGEGMSLMPGLIDCHVHIQGLNNRSDEDSDQFLYGTVPGIFMDKLLPYGVTTIKDLCAPRHFIYKLRDEIKAGKITGPELLVVGPNFTAPGGHPASTLGGDNPWIRKEMAIEVSTPEQVSAGIRELKADGVDFLKLTYQGGDYWYFNKKLQINKLSKSLMQQVIQEGKEHGLQTTAHVFYKDDVRELLEAGIYGIEHGVLDEALAADDDLITLWKESDTHYVPTVNAMTYEKDPNYLTNNMHNLKLLYDAGVHLAMGTDNMLEVMGGEVEHRELLYYVEAGLTPMQAIGLATKNAAEHLGIADRKGLVREGMEADLILLEKNPAEDISNMQFIDKVFLRGKVVFSQKPISSYDLPDYSYPASLLAMTYQRPDGTGTRTVDVSRYADEGVIAQTTTADNGVLCEEEYTVEHNLSCTAWRYTRASDSTELTATKQDGYIKLSGTFRGKPQERTYKIGNGLWYQMMDLALSAFVASNEEQVVFYSIGTGDNRGALGLGEFQANKDGEEAVEVCGRIYNCMKVTLVLTAFPWAWTGLFWYDKKTGQLVKSGEKRKKAVETNYQLLAME